LGALGKNTFADLLIELNVLQHQLDYKDGHGCKVMSLETPQLIEWFINGTSTHNTLLAPTNGK
jgi:hypothetical protein